MIFKFVHRFVVMSLKSKNIMYVLSLLSSQNIHNNLCPCIAQVGFVKEHCGSCCPGRCVRSAPPVLFRASAPGDRNSNMPREKLNPYV